VVKAVKSKLEKVEITTVNAMDNGNHIAQMALNTKMNHPNVSQAVRDEHAKEADRVTDMALVLARRPINQCLRCVFSLVHRRPHLPS